LGRALTVTAAIVAQADRRVGTGHLRESLIVARFLGKRAALAVGARTPASFINGSRARRLASLSPKALAAWARAAKGAGARVVLANLWDPSAAQARALKSAGLPVVMMDEVGGKALSADVVINPMLLSTRYLGSRARLLAGPAWLALDPLYKKLARRKRATRGPLRRLLVTFGGLDRTGATARAAKLLRRLRPGLKTTLVLGPGFSDHAALARAVSGAAGLTLVRGATSLARLIADSDAVLTAGGNTLCEAACLGVPALVAHEDPHERLHGLTWQREGFARCLGPGRRLTARALSKALDELDDPAARRRRGASGRRLVDGRGAERIAELLVRFSR